MPPLIGPSLRHRSRLLMRAIQSAALTGVLVAAAVAMLALVVALLPLLRETQIATAQLSRRF